MTLDKSRDRLQLTTLHGSWRSRLPAVPVLCYTSADPGRAPKGMRSMDAIFVP